MYESLYVCTYVLAKVVIVPVTMRIRFYAAVFVSFCFFFFYLSPFFFSLLEFGVAFEVFLGCALRADFGIGCGCEEMK